MSLDRVLENIFRKPILLFFAYLVVCSALYWPALHGNYELDDAHTVQINSSIQDLSWSRVVEIFLDARTSSAIPENATLRPLTTLSFALCWKAAGGKTWPFHFYKWLLHSGAAVLVFFILKKVLQTLKSQTFLSSTLINVSVLEWICFFSGLLFLVHPAQTESAIYISATGTLQCAFFYLLGFYFFQLRNIGLYLLFFLCGTLCKEEGATFPAMCFLWLTLFCSEMDRKQKIKHMILVTIAFLFYVLFYAQFHPASGFKSMVSVSRSSYLFTQIRAWWYYLGWIVFPMGLSIEHMTFKFSESFFELKVLIASFATIVIIGWSAFRSVLDERFKVILFLVLGYFVTILPASSIFVLAEPLNMHRYYLPYAFAIPGFVVGIWFIYQRYFSKILVHRVILFFSILVFMFGVLTFHRAQIWGDSLALWEEAIEKDPGNGRAHNNAGILYMAKGNYSKALEHFDACIKTWDRYKYCYVNRFIALQSTGKKSEARDAIKRALELDPESIAVLFYAAKFEHQEAKNDELALEYLRRCEALALNRNEGCFGLELEILEGHLKQKKNVNQRALEVIEATSKLGPIGKPAIFKFGIKQINEKNLDLAKKTFELYIKHNPSDHQGYYNLGFVHRQQGDWESAKQQYLKSAALHNNAKDTWTNIKETAQKTNDQNLEKKAEIELKK